MVYIGCDQHKHFCQLAIIDNTGKMIEQKKLYHNDPENLKKYFESLPKDSEMAVEASGFEAWLCDFVEALGIKVHLSHPLKTRAIAEAKIKTDKVDAKILGELLRVDLLPKAYLAPLHIRKQRYFLRYRICLTRYRTSLKNRIHNLLHHLGLRPPLATDLFGVKGRHYLDSIKLDFPYQDALNGYLKLLNTTEDRLYSVGRRLSILLKENSDAKLLQTVPGIGVFLSQLILAEIGSINRFPSSDKLSSYAGLVPSLYQSGKTLRRGSCSKEGNKFLRWAVVEAAHTAVRKDPLLKDFYERIKGKKGSQKAIVASARKLLVTVFHVLTKKEPYKYRSYIPNKPVSEGLS